MPHWLRINPWRFLLILGVFAVLALGAACGDDDDGGDDGGEPTATEASGKFPVVTIAAGGTIKVGVTAVLSGDLIALGTTVRDASILAAEQLGQVEGFDIEIVGADDGCAADPGLAAAEILLAEDGLVAVIGSICSGVNVAIQPIYEEAGITQVSSGSTATVVTHPEGRDPFATFVRTVVHDGVQGVKQAEFATDVIGATTAFSAHDTDTYGTGLKDVFNGAFTDLGGEILGTEGWEKGQTDFSALVTTVTTASPDLVYVASFDPEASAFLRQLRDAGFEGDFLSGDGVITDQFLTNTGDAAEGAYLSKPAPLTESDALTQFQDDFEGKFGYPSNDQPYAPESYDAMHVIFNALTEVAELQDDGSLSIDLGALNEAIRAQSFDGLIGAVAFDENGDIKEIPGKPAIAFFKVEGGAYVPEEFE